MQTIIVKVGQTRIETHNANLARQVLEASTNLQPHPLAELTSISIGGRALIPPRIGEFWKGQGGIYAGLMRGEGNQPDYHLVVAIGDQAEVEEIAWGGAGQAESGAGSEWDGHANTLALAESEHSHRAAEWAATRDVDGHRDFYLPARRELRLCWVNVPELFAGAWYWSSTQYSPDTAWIQDFDDGDQGDDHKDYEHRARAVRRVLTTSTL
ncbi:DUF1566 domain-containing protein [Stutzerimonas stutzeri]|uniref:DUF1566 domain-containing protein n=1 Tax=Stutzerimonas stutzeri TaxID=316 RepID=UPI001BCDC4D7|nr:DUF1566 domain-containing protein [Stutzerimonas stutzeri]